MAADPDHQVVFIAGALRSGSTLFRIMLNQHPAISNPGEFDFLFDGDHEGPGTGSPVEYREQLRHDRIFLSHNLGLRNLPDVRSQIEDLVTQVRQPGNLLTLNIHRNFERALDVFPNAKFIHLLRDPRDVARSSIYMGWVGNVYYGVDHWISTERSWGDIKHMLMDSQFMEIRYESLVKDTEITLSKVCAFVGVPYSDAMLKFPDDSTYGTPDPAFAEQWKKKLSTREIRLVEYKAGGLLIERGYSVSGDSDHRLSSWHRAWLWIENFWVRNRFSFDRYGSSLWMREKVSRVLGLKRMWVRCRLLMNEINKKSLR